MGFILSYLAQMALPAAFGALLWRLTCPLRERSLSRKQLSAGPYRERAILIFFVYLSVLLGLTLTPHGFWLSILRGQRPVLPDPFQGGVNLIPFRAGWYLLSYYMRNGLWTAFWVNYPGNVVMFLPMGFFASLLSDKPRWWKGTLLAFSMSVFIEVFQLFVSRGTDIDDVILNTLGGLLGHLLFVLLKNLEPKFVRGFKKV